MYEHLAERPVGLPASQLQQALLSAAQWHLDEVHDPQLAAELRAWIEIKPRLG
ncbi:hypothetical protein [Micromonospora sp. HK10]|uniref:hypothetical protein n=1 Tax=Micromonospora sp. HK10 TaxID=1538294 RepID=UPI000AFDB0D0|nr:hypothetical protein [Micromonospora sp. HK10]